MISSSPFTPRHPVQSGFFAGRIREIQRLRRLVGTIAKGQLPVGFIAGERGVGKSSLASYVRQLVERDDEAVGCHVQLGEVNDLGGLMEATLRQVLEDSVDRPWHAKIREMFGDRVEKVGVFNSGLELTFKKKDLRSPGHSFLPALRQLLALRRDDPSILLILDDINGLAKSREFANWLKSLVDDVATSRRQPRLCMLLVGLEERIREMMAQQPSVGRVFDRVDISPWSDDETKDFYRVMFQRRRATVSENGLRTLTAFTGGFPIVAHEIGAAVWDVANDLEIRDEEVFEGIWRAADIVSQRLLPPGGLEIIRGESCRSILGSMEEPRIAIHRSELVSGLGKKEQNRVDGLLSRMKKVGVLESAPFERGEYRFPSLLHALSVWQETKRPLRKSSGRRSVGRR